MRAEKGGSEQTDLFGLLLEQDPWKEESGRGGLLKQNVQQQHSSYLGIQSHLHRLGNEKVWIIYWAIIVVAQLPPVFVAYSIFDGAPCLSQELGFF